MKRSWRIGLVLGLLVLQAACIPKVEQPRVQLDGARLSSIGLNGGVVDVHLSVYNPNRFALQANGLSYDLDIRVPGSDDWVDFTDGRLDQRVHIEPGETGEVVVPVDFTFQRLGEIARALLDRGTLEYRVSGEVAVEEPVRRGLGYNHSGEVTPSGVR